MKCKIILLIVFSFFLNLNSFSQNRFIYVSPHGDDYNGDGSIDNPYKSIYKAKNQVIALKQSLYDNIYVLFREGTFYLDNPIDFLSEDGGGIPNKRIVYKAYNNEKVIFSAGLEISYNNKTWEKEGDLYRINVKNIDSNISAIPQLYFNGNPMQRSRMNIDHINFKIKNDTTFIFDNDTSGYISLIDNFNDVELVSEYSWIFQKTKIKSIVNNMIVIDTNFKMLIIGEHWCPNFLYLENAKPFIDEPNEFYFDKKTKVLYISRNAIIDTSSLSIIIPRNIPLINLTNVSNISFEDFQFSYSTWGLFDSIGYHPMQGSAYRFPRFIDWGYNLIPGAVNIKGSSNIIFNNNCFKYLGLEGITIGNGSKKIQILNNIFEDISSSAIRVGHQNASFWLKKNENSSSITENIDIVSNTINNCANQYFSSTGIFVTFARNINILNNNISKLPYTGISIGYDWTDSVHPQYGNISIENNFISDVCNFMSDGAGIYNLGTHYNKSIIKGNEIRNIKNHKEHVYPFIFTDDNKRPIYDSNNCYLYEKRNTLSPRAGIYLDQGSSNIDVIDNFGQEFKKFYDGKNSEIFSNENYPCERINSKFSNNNFDGCNNHWFRIINYVPNYHFATESYGDFDVKFVDVNHDSLKDLVYFRWLSLDNYQIGTYLNEGKKWSERLTGHSYNIPYHTYVDGSGSLKVDFIDVDGDGFDDLLYNRISYNQKGCFINNGFGWSLLQDYAPPIPHFSDTIGDMGVRYIDVDHNGLKDLLYFRWINVDSSVRGVYLNNGFEWVLSNNVNLLPPVNFAGDFHGDLGVRFVDLNGDGFDDIVYHRIVHSKEIHNFAYINSGNGWLLDSNYLLPYPTVIDSIGTMGFAFIDVNKDGLKDFIYNRQIDSVSSIKAVYLNQNNKWVLSNNCSYNTPIPLSIDGQKSQGIHFVDLNKDGYDDIIRNYWPNSGSAIKQVWLNGSNQLYCNDLSNPITSINKNVINEQKKDSLFRFELSIYPNPFSAYLNFESYQKDEKNIVCIYDIFGDLIDTFSFFNSYTYQTDKLNNGLFLIKISSKNETILRKVLKK